MVLRRYNEAHDHITNDTADDGQQRTFLQIKVEMVVRYHEAAKIS